MVATTTRDGDYALGWHCERYISQMCDTRVTPAYYCLPLALNVRVMSCPGVVKAVHMARAMHDSTARSAPRMHAWTVLYKKRSDRDWNVQWTINKHFKLGLVWRLKNKSHSAEAELFSVENNTSMTNHPCGRINTGGFKGAR